MEKEKGVFPSSQPCAVTPESNLAAHEIGMSRPWYGSDIGLFPVNGARVEFCKPFFEQRRWLSIHSNLLKIGERHPGNVGVFHIGNNDRIAAQADLSLEDLAVPC